MAISRAEQVVELARKKGLLRPRDLAEIGLSRQYLSVVYRRGLLERVSRGIYCLPGFALDENQSLVEVCTKVPSGVICLLTALSFHDLTTQVPFEVHLAISRTARRPQMDSLQLRVYRFSGPALTEGVEEHSIAGVKIQVYSLAKTVVDCFKFRNKIGLDVAIEALRDCLHQRKTTVDELVHFSGLCRVEKVMAPYIEAML